MAKSFHGKVLLITGAARGIGAGVARAYVAQGGRVALLGLEPERLAALSDELGDAAAWWEADARDGAAIRTAVDAAAAHFGRIDHVVANAGIASYGTVRQIDDESFERVIDIKLNKEEQEMFDKSVDAVKGLIEACKAIDPSLS